MIVKNLYIKFDSWEESNLAMEKIFADRNVVSVTLFGTWQEPNDGTIHAMMDPYINFMNNITVLGPASAHDQFGMNNVSKDRCTLEYCQSILAQKNWLWWRFFPVFRSDSEKSHDQIRNSSEKPMQALKMINAPLITRTERDRMDALEDKLNFLAEKIDSLETRLETGLRNQLESKSTD